MSLRPNAKAELRRNRYKLGVDAEESRKRREDNLVEIRKNKREESLMKKRREGSQAPQDFLPISAASVENHLKKLLNVAGIWSDDHLLQLESTTHFRMILSIDNAYGLIDTIDLVIESGVVPRFVEFLTKEDFPRLQFEAAWALSNIASGTSEHTKVVVDHNAVPIFIQLLASPNDNVREQAMWALGNIAGDSIQFRDFVIQCGALMPLLALFNEHSELSILRIFTWTLSSFFRGKPQPPFDQVKPALSAFVRLVHFNDEEVLSDACLSLSYLSCGTDEQIQSVIEAGVVPRLIELLLHPSPCVLTPALRTVGNIALGNTQQTQCVIDYGALPILANLLTQNLKKQIKKEACWMISNITAGTEEQIQSVINANLIPTMVNVAQNAEFDIKKEAVWAITNATAGGSHDQIKYLVEQNSIKPLCDLLVSPDVGMVLVCLDGLENILKVGEAVKKRGGEVNYTQLIEDAEGLEKIEQLQSHDNNLIYEKSVKIVETYWFEDTPLFLVDQRPYPFH